MKSRKGKKQLNWKNLNVENMKTEEEIEKLYYEKLTYEKGDERRKVYIISRFTDRELKHMFEILFKCKPYRIKTLNFDYIQEHFENKEKQKGIENDNNKTNRCTSRTNKRTNKKRA